MEFYPEASHPNYVISLGGIPQCSFAAFTCVKHKMSALGHLERSLCLRNLWLRKALTEVLKTNSPTQGTIVYGAVVALVWWMFQLSVSEMHVDCRMQVFACVSKYVHACMHSWWDSGLDKERADIVCALWLPLRSSVQLPRGQDALGVCCICQACRDKLPRLNCSFPSTQVVFTPSSPQ